jgi:sporulation protein YlmC with PRC-barrel domain
MKKKEMFYNEHDMLVTDQKRFLKVLLDASELRFEKLKQYGLCYDSFGAMGISMRLKDKVSRLINFYESQLYNKDIEKSFRESSETVKDTLLDIINYAVMGIMVIENNEKKLFDNINKKKKEFPKNSTLIYYLMNDKSEAKK